MIAVRRAADRTVSDDRHRVPALLLGRRALRPGQHRLRTADRRGRARVAPGAGFARHAHRGVVIVSWVLDGVLRHEDSTGHRTTVRPGMVQHLSAGSGVSHAERNGGDDELRFIQMWLLDDRLGEPAYGAEAAESLRLHKANLHVARLVGQPITLPEAPFVHVFVARGSAEVTAAGPLATGDAVRIFGCDGHRVSGDAELLILEMHADATG